MLGNNQSERPPIVRAAHDAISLTTPPLATSVVDQPWTALPLSWFQSNIIPLAWIVAVPVVPVNLKLFP